MYNRLSFVFPCVNLGAVRSAGDHEVQRKAHLCAEELSDGALMIVNCAMQLLGCNARNHLILAPLHIAIDESSKPS